MNCAKCGTELKPGQEYCGRCAAAVPQPAVYKAGGFSAVPASPAPPVVPPAESLVYSPAASAHQAAPAAHSQAAPVPPAPAVPPPIKPPAYTTAAPAPQAAPEVPSVESPVYPSAASAFQTPPVVPAAESPVYSTASAGRPPIPPTPPPSYMGYRAAPAYGMPQQYPPYQPGYPMGAPAYGWGYTMPQPPPAWQPKKLAKKQQDPQADLPFSTTELLSAKQCFATILLGLIPLAGIILCLMWRNSDTAPPQKKNMASALLALHGIALALLVAGLAVWVFNLWGALPPGAF